MNTLSAAIVPGLIAGVVSLFTSWFWMGLVFHRYQRATPETWGPEGPRNYALSSLVRVFSAVAISFLYVLVARFHEEKKEITTFDPNRPVPDDVTLRRRLKPEQYRVVRENGTDRKSVV